MAVYYTGGGGGFLGGLGKVLGLGASLIPGMQWAAPVAAGIGAIDAASRGDIGGAAENAMGAVGNAGGAYKGMQGASSAPVQNIAETPWANPQDEAWNDFYMRNKRRVW